MSGFAAPITDNEGALVRAQIKSPDFNQATQTGWALLKDGEAFVYSLTAKGAVTANSVVVEGSGDGLFVYDGTPALGNLIIAIAAEAGTDQYGNSYSGPGIAVSVPGGGSNVIQVRPDLGALLVYAS